MATAVSDREAGKNQGITHPLKAINWSKTMAREREREKGSVCRPDVVINAYLTG